MYLYAEKWDGQQWVLAEPAVPDQTCILDIPIPPEDWAWIPDFFGLSRNYTFFALMADVRNSNDLIPIALPRGAPTDITLEGKTVLEQVMPYSHSLGWLLLSEILDVDWQSMIAKGLLSDAYLQQTFTLLQQHSPSQPDQPVRFIFWFN